MKKIGILYICTGNYSVFWDEFYRSFEENFLNGHEVHYFVFTDDESLLTRSELPRVHIYKQQQQPWPLVTLLRFHTFLSVTSELAKMEYLFFFNSNLKCIAPVSAEEILPGEGSQQRLVVCPHPGYLKVHRYYAPFDRHPKSRAYVSYRSGRCYVIGALIGGTAEAFLSMSSELATAVSQDLKANVIARWHDESHLNRYIVGRSDVRYVSTSLCYPYGVELECEKKIVAVGKADRFDVAGFKGVNLSASAVPLFTRIRKKLSRVVGPWLWAAIGR